MENFVHQKHELTSHLQVAFSRSPKVAENHYHPQRGIYYPTFLWFETEPNKEQCKFLI